MARNEEKQLARLNRFLLQKQHEEEKKKNPPRPHLGSLSTAPEIKKWLPSLTKELDFYLKQMEVGCYPDRKIAEFQTRIRHLQQQYKAFVRKLRDLHSDPKTFQVPWEDRPYNTTSANKRVAESDAGSSKKTKTENSGSTEDQANIPHQSSAVTKAGRLPLPLLDGSIEQSYEQFPVLPLEGSMEQPDETVPNETVPSPLLQGSIEQPNEQLSLALLEGSTEPSLESFESEPEATTMWQHCDTSLLDKPLLFSYHQESESQISESRHSDLKSPGICQDLQRKNSFRSENTGADTKERSPDSALPKCSSILVEYSDSDSDDR